MKKIIFVITAMLIFSSCANTGSVNYSSNTPAISDRFLVTPPQSGTLVIVGVSGKQSKREYEINSAMEDAARKAAMYHGVHVNAEYVQNIGSGFLDYYTASNVNLRYDERLELYMDKLDFNKDRDIVNTSGGVFIRFTFPAAFPGSVSYSFARKPNGRPEWIENPPGMISGFIAGVGYSARQWKLQDTFTKSRDSAAAAIVSQLYTRMTTSGVSVDSRSNSRIRQRSEGYINNFLVLEIWIDPGNQDVWTLAIAQKAN